MAFRCLFARISRTFDICVDLVGDVGFSISQLLHSDGNCQQLSAEIEEKAQESHHSRVNNQKGKLIFFFTVQFLISNTFYLLIKYLLQLLEELCCAINALSRDYFPLFSIIFWIFNTHFQMVFFLVGLGLGDVEDITTRGLKALRKCSKVYLEAYTSILCYGLDKSRLQEFCGTEVIEASREFVEMDGIRFVMF